MSTYKPKNSSIFQYDFWLNGSRFYGSTGCKTKRDADRVEQRKRAIAALDDGKRKKKPITLDDAAGLYDIRLRETGKWSPTADYIMADLVASLGGNRYLSDITQEELSGHFARRAAVVSASSVNREIDVARPIWRRVRKTHDIGDMPDWGALRYAVPENDPREMFEDEEDRLFPELRADLADFCSFALQAGWRQAEVLGLRWADCNLNAAIAETRIKGGDVVKRPLTQEMVILIANQPKVGPFVFTYVCQKNKSACVDKWGRVQPARRKGERYPMTKTVLRKPWAAAKKQAGVEKLRFHDLRHTAGTRILRQTNNLVLVKEALKHRNIKTTLRYAHAADDDVRKALEASRSRNSPEVASSNVQKPRKSAKNDV